MEEENLAPLINPNNTPFAKHLGVNLTFASKTRVEGEMIVREDLCTIPMTVHGGALMGFADGLGGVAAFLNTPEGSYTTTVESKTNFYRPIQPGDKAIGVCECVHMGKTLQTWTTRITRGDGKLVAVVTQTQMSVESK